MARVSGPATIGSMRQYGYIEAHCMGIGADWLGQAAHPVAGRGCLVCEGRRGHETVCFQGVGQTMKRCR